jgi:peptidoglycan/xylan/chitin deacetylase (PgdA/CDA1 family)
MPDLAAVIDDRLNRVTNRLMRRFPGPPVEIAPERAIVSFTFDDVPDTALSNGARILEAHGVRGTFYIAGGLADRVEPGRTLISPSGIAALAARGHEIGCHTFSHGNVRKTPPAALRADLDRNRAFLTGTIGGPPPESFAFPFNAMSPFATGELRRRFRSARGGREGINRGPVDPMLLRAVEIRSPDAHARGLTRWIDDAVESPAWLIFFVHDIAEPHTDYGTTPEIFDALVAHALARGAAVLPVAAALDRLGVPRRPA